MLRSPKLFFAMVAFPLVVTGCSGESKEFASFSHSGVVFDLDFVSESKEFISTQIKEGSTELWSLNDPKAPVGIVSNGISVDFSARTRIAAIGTLHGEVILWDAERRRDIYRWKLEEESSAIAASFSPDGALLAIAEGPRWTNSWNNGLNNNLVPKRFYSILIYDIRTKDRVHRITGLHEFANSICITPDNDHVLFSLQRGTAALWSVKNQDYIWNEDRQYWQNDLREKTGRTLIYGAPRISTLRDGASFYWQGLIKTTMTNKTEIALIADGQKNFELGVPSGDGKTLITAGSGGLMSLWDTANGKNLGNIRASRNGAMVTAIAISPDEQYVLTGTTGRIGGFDAIAQNKSAKDPYIRLWKVDDLLKGAPSAGQATP